MNESGATSRPGPGLVLADSRYEAEANAYLQRRLTIFYGVTVAIAGSLYVVGGVIWAVSLDLYTAFVDPGRTVHLAAIVFSSIILLSLRRCDYPSRTLVFLDALGLQITFVAGISIYAIQYHLAPHSMSAVLSLFLIARAVVVPCSARVTFLLSLPAPLGVLAVQLLHGEGYAQMGELMAHDYYVNWIVWNQLALWLAVGVATLASRINFGLRHQVREATRLGQYRLEELIGRGGMGEVYRASHAMLRRPTAIKVVHPDAADPELIARFTREVQGTARLTHPNTVQIFDYGRTPEGAFYYAMEYLDGANLQQIVEKTEPMPASRAIHVMVQLCGALREAHQHDLVHRDVKPGNVILCARGGEHDVAKLVDFGLVKDLTATSASLTQIGQVCGTPETIAPEVLGGDAITPSADLYALGVVGYYMMSGKHIFDSRSAADMIGHHLHSPPIPLRDRIPDAPEDLERVLLKCLEKNPKDRIQSASELRQELKRCLDANLWTERNAATWWSSHNDLRRAGTPR